MKNGEHPPGKKFDQKFFAWGTRRGLDFPNLPRFFVRLLNWD